MTMPRKDWPKKEPRDTLVLVTGASGFIASHVVDLLLKKGFRVRGTVRSLKNPAKVEPVRRLDKHGQLELVEADLLRESDWPRVVAGCDYVLHIASPFPIIADESCIATAVNGTLNVLKAVAKSYTVRKVVLTSSCTAVNEGHKQGVVFNEDSWSLTDSKSVGYYPKSKTLAERAAWDFVASLTDKDNLFALTAINPVFVIGPPLIDEQGASISVIRQFLHHEIPVLPPMQLALVDVRDVAICHVEAMLRPQSDGHRILASATPSFWFKDISRVLAKEFRSQGYSIPRYEVPAIFIWLYSWIDKQSASILDRLGFEVKFDNSKARKLLDVEFVNPSDALVDMAYTLIERGIVKKTREYRGRPKNLPPKL